MLWGQEVPGRAKVGGRRVGLCVGLDVHMWA